MNTMQNLKFLLLSIAGVLLLPSCAQNETETAYVKQKETTENVALKDTPQMDPSSEAETTPESIVSAPDSCSFSSENANLKLVDSTIQEPIYEFIIENPEKLYDNTVDGTYPDIKIDPKNEFAGIGWWPDQNQIHLQLWNINDEPEIIFYLDEEECKIVFPESEKYEKRYVNQTFRISEKAFLIESIYIYNDFISLNIEQTEGTMKPPANFSIKIDGTLYSPSNVHFNDLTGEIKLLYNIGKRNLEHPLELEGILYNEEQIITLE